MSIKLILTDMDGTLLNDQKELPEDIEQVLEACVQNDIVFGIASGRQMRTIQLPFEKYKEHMAFIAENGGYAVLKGQTVLFSAMKADLVQDIAKVCKNLDNVYPILCGMDCAYIDSEDPRLLEQCAEYYKSTRVVEDLTHVNVPICKIAICDFNGAEYSTYPIFQNYDESLQTTLSGAIWVDITNRGMSKGNGLVKFQEQMGITEADTITFGDYLNDVGLFEHSIGYAMKNSHPDLFPYAKHITDYTNNENGVTRVIWNYIKKQEGEL